MNVRRVLKWTGITFVTLACLLAGLVAQGFFRFDLQLTNPVIAKINARQDRRWGSLTELTPDVFRKGMSENEVLGLLTRQGFVRMTEETLWERYRADFERGDWIFFREANIIACKVNAYVFVRFAGDRTMLSAQGTVHEHGCL